MMTNLPPPSLETVRLSVRWTRADCEKLEAAGILWFWYELVEGIILRMPDKTPRHRAFVERVDGWLAQHFEAGFVLVAHALTVAPNENVTTRLVSDSILLNRRSDRMQGDEPSPRDILLIVEVSDTTLEYDLTTKAGVYSRAGIAQYLVIDIVGRVVYDHRLSADGTYHRETRRPGDAIVLAASPGLPLTVDDLLLPL